MDFIVNEPDKLYDTFFENFNSLWTRPNQRESFRAYMLGLICEAHRKNIQALSCKIIGQQSQSLHHFLCKSPWDSEELNRRRIHLLQSDPRTASRPGGVLILDDTGVPKKGDATEGVKRQYIGQLGKVANGQVFVTTHYADDRCHWPVDIAPYVPDTWLEGGKDDPGFRTKIELALELIERAQGHGLAFQAVIADIWYGSNPKFINTLEQHEVPYIAQVKRSMRIFARLPGDIARNEHRLEQALSLLKPEDFRPVRLKAADGTERHVHLARLNVKLKKIPGRRRVLVLTHRPDDPAADEDLRFLISNVVALRNETVVRRFALRNWIEVFYREAKDDLGAGQYQVRELNSIVRHWQLVFLAYSLVQRLRRDGRLARWSKKKLRTARQTLMALRDYLRQVWVLDWLPAHVEVFKEHLNATGYLFPRPS